VAADGRNVLTGDPYEIAARLNCGERNSYSVCGASPDMAKFLQHHRHRVSTVSWRAHLAFPVGAALVAAGATLAFTAPSAGARPVAAPSGHGHGPAVVNGDNGTVKIHRSTTAVTDRRNEPHVCVFYLDAFGFDPGQSVSWQIKSWPPTGDRTVVDQGTLTLDSSGDGRTSDQTLPNGHYKLFWTFSGEHGAAKQKVFWVSCPSSTPSPTPKPTPSLPTPTPTCACHTPSPPTPKPTSSSLTSTPPSASPAPSPTASIAPAPAPAPVQASLPVTG
jgi:hypothetical protein